MAHDIGRLDPETREALEALGRVLRDLRGSRGLSQRALAGRCGLSQSTISRLECGLAEGVRIAWVARLLAGLDTRLNLISDDRSALDRSHAFRMLWKAFSPVAGDSRRQARARQRDQRLGAYARRQRGD